jgi:hypothetical protein
LVASQIQEIQPGPVAQFRAIEFIAANQVDGYSSGQEFRG